MAVTIDIDAGGTFTDGFVVRDGVVHTVKTLTTPHDLAVCFRDVVDAAARELGCDVGAMLRETVAVRYATTVGTNAVLQRAGPRLGLLTDAAVDPDRGGVGLFVDPEMVEVVDVEGPLEGPGSVAAGMRSLLERGARGLVAAGHAADGTGRDELEATLGATFAEHHPRHCLDAAPFLSAGEVAADDDPVRRQATALFDAYVHPEVADYLYRAEDYLREHGYTRPLRVVHNDGGAARVARTVAGKTYSSGPMAGLLGARAVAEVLEVGDLITLDMGGTSLDVGVVRAGEVPMLRHGRVEGVEVSFPLPDLVPLGLGGGSIARVGDDGAPRVGPRSAGAHPGPACFARGGTEPTLTDADVLVGVLRARAFLGGAMTLDPAAAERAYGPLAESLGCDEVQAAARVLDSAHHDAGRRLADELAERGLDPGATTALAFGGNGATHGAGIAAAAGIAEVVVLPFAPVFSAFGASTVDLRHRRQGPADRVDPEDLRRRVLRDMRGEGVAAHDVDLQTAVVSRDGADWVVVEGVHALPHVDLRRSDHSAITGAGAEVAEETGTTVHWPGHGPRPTRVLDRSGLAAGDHVTGPALVDAGSTTCAVPPGWSLHIDDRGAVRLRGAT